MTPDELFGAWGLVIQDVFGKQAQFRREPITLREWAKLEERWQTMKNMNIGALVDKVLAERERSKGEGQP